MIDANKKMHSIRIVNLKAGTKYKYRIVSKEILQYDPYEVIFGDSVVDEILDFETLDPGKTSFSFGVVTDLHERGPMLDTLLQVIPTDSLDMMFFTGDMLNWIGSEERIFSGFLKDNTSGDESGALENVKLTASGAISGALPWNVSLTLATWSLKACHCLIGSNV